MTFSPTQDSVKLLCAVHIQVWDTDTEDTRDLYLANGELIVGGQLYMGRLQNPRASFIAPKLYQQNWTHPTFTANVITDGNAGGGLDFWDTYLASTIVWRGAEATVYSVDLGTGDSKTEMIGKVVRGPSQIRKGGSFQLQIDGTNPNVRLPGANFGIPSESDCRYLQPRIQAAETLNGAINATTTTIVLNGAPLGVIWQNRMGIAIESELCYIQSNVLATGTFTVVRGYAGTTAASHADTTTARLVRLGPVSDGAASGGADTVLPIAFGAYNQDRGQVWPVWPQATDLTGGGGEYLFWISGGKIGNAAKCWKSVGGTVTEYTTADNLEAFNDIDDGFSINNLGFPGPPAIVHPLPAGAYAYLDVSISVGGFIPTEDSAWYMGRGVKAGVSGDVVVYLCGAAKYLAENPDGGCGLSDAFYTGRIDDYETGDWQDEYTEAYASSIAGVCPAWGAGEMPTLMSALHDLAMGLGAGDMFTREGQIYPARRTVKATADWTVAGWNALEPPEVSYDPFKDYCNVLTIKFAQAVLSEGHDANDLEPAEIPFSVTVRAPDAITANGDEIVSAELVLKYFRPELSADWIQNETDQMVSHLDYLRTLADDHLALRAQQQVWMKCRLPHTFFAIEQGDTIVFDIDGYPTAKGQVRDVIRNYSDGTVEVTSWHVNM